jgi:integrase
LPDAEQSRNVIIPEDAILSIISAAYAVSREFGLLVEVAAVTGARVSQLARLEVGDLQCDRSDPRLMMPSARKGRGLKRIERRPVPIPTNLAILLNQTGAGRSNEAPLLTKPNGELWRPSDHRHPFARAVTTAGLDIASCASLIAFTSSAAARSDAINPARGESSSMEVPSEAGVMAGS